ncbi:MAG: hypothetical protein AB7S78_00700 [Candidatus Omnitrophota bacterium]
MKTASAGCYRQFDGTAWQKNRRFRVSCFVDLWPNYPEIRQLRPGINPTGYKQDNCTPHTKDECKPGFDPNYPTDIADPEKSNNGLQPKPNDNQTEADKEYFI